MHDIKLLIYFWKYLFCIVDCQFYKNVVIYFFDASSNLGSFRVSCTYIRPYNKEQENKEYKEYQENKVGQDKQEYTTFCKRIHEY